MDSSLIELLTYYVIAGALIVGAPAYSSSLLYAALQNTKGRMVGYKDHKMYGDSSIYENTKSDSDRYFLQISGNNP